MFHLARHLFKQANSAVDDRGDPATAAPRGSRLPIWLKLVYTAFVCVLVPHYWSAYGPTNFLYFCDIALLLTLLGLWREDPLLVSMPAVGILLPQALWMTDFVSAAVGIPLTGMTSYMFDPQLSLFTRGLSFFHFWLPILLVWLVWRLGYDRRISRVDTAGLGAGAGLLFLDAGPASAGGSTESSGQHQLCLRFQQPTPADVAAAAGLSCADAGFASHGDLLADAPSATKIFRAPRADPVTAGRPLVWADWLEGAEAVHSERAARCDR